MEKENIIKEEREVAMVECPFCNKPIEAPVNIDVIFTCPNCHKELITYDKSKDPKQEIGKAAKTYKINKQILKGGCIAALISLLLYASITNNTDMNATYIVTKEYDAAINVKEEKALVNASVEGDKMKILEIIGNRKTIHFFQGDQVKISRDVVRGFPNLYRVERISDGASALMPKKYLKKK